MVSRPTPRGSGSRSHGRPRPRSVAEHWRPCSFRDVGRVHPAVDIGLAVSVYDMVRVLCALHNSGDFGRASFRSSGSSRSCSTSVVRAARELNHVADFDLRVRGSGSTRRKNRRKKHSPLLYAIKSKNTAQKIQEKFIYQRVLKNACPRESSIYITIQTHRNSQTLPQKLQMT